MNKFSMTRLNSVGTYLSHARGWRVYMSDAGCSEWYCSISLFKTDPRLSLAPVTLMSICQVIWTDMIHSIELFSYQICQIIWTDMNQGIETVDQFVNLSWPTVNLIHYFSPCYFWPSESHVKNAVRDCFAAKNEDYEFTNGCTPNLNYYTLPEVILLKQLVIDIGAISRFRFQNFHWTWLKNQCTGNINSLVWKWTGDMTMKAAKIFRLL